MRGAAVVGPARGCQGRPNDCSSRARTGALDRCGHAWSRTHRPKAAFRQWANLLVVAGLTGLEQLLRCSELTNIRQRSARLQSQVEDNWQRTWLSCQNFDVPEHTGGKFAQTVRSRLLARKQLSSESLFDLRFHKGNSLPQCVHQSSRCCCPPAR